MYLMHDTQKSDSLLFLMLSLKWYMAISGNQLLLVLHQKTAIDTLFTV